VWRGGSYYYSIRLSLTKRQIQARTRYRHLLYNPHDLVCSIRYYSLPLMPLASAYLIYKIRIPASPGAFLVDYSPLELKKVLRKNGIDSPKAGRKNLTAATAIELLKDAGRLPSVAAAPEMPSISSVLIFALPRFILGLPLRMFSSKKKEDGEKVE
jgi:hypothetical protein